MKCACWHITLKIKNLYAEFYVKQNNNCWSFKVPIKLGNLARQLSLQGNNRNKGAIRYDEIILIASNYSLHCVFQNPSKNKVKNQKIHLLKVCNSVSLKDF